LVCVFCKRGEAETGFSLAFAQGVGVMDFITFS
jgi:hypothetical protein